MRHTILVTGASGYIGAMVVKQLASHDSVETVIALDKDPMPELLQDVEKVTFLQINTADKWQGLVASLSPTIVINCAWQIREIYGNRELSWRWNIDGSDAVFDFCFENEFVEKLIHISSIASYGAFKENKMDRFFTEADPLRESAALYPEEKRISENHLRQKFELNHHVHPSLSVTVLRPASITGPRGRFMRESIGLQSALSGELKKTFIHNAISVMTAFVPVTKTWLRQFIHEDDVVAIIERSALEEKKEVGVLETYIMCPPGDVVLGADMARIVGKKVLVLPPTLIRLVFFVAWHLTRGRIPTAPGSWKGYSYPIPVDGSKITREKGYVYTYSGSDALEYTDGAFEYAVPPLKRVNKKI
jgi:nucleoside-diphosphate-sugar epimerase